LIEAAESFASPAQVSYGQSASQPPAEEEDESLAAMLLRLLRAPDTGENTGAPDSAAPSAASASRNPSVG